MLRGYLRWWKKVPQTEPLHNRFDPVILLNYWWNSLCNVHKIFQPIGKKICVVMYVGYRSRMVEWKWWIKMMRQQICHWLCFFMLELLKNCNVISIRSQFTFIDIFFFAKTLNIMHYSNSFYWFELTKLLRIKSGDIFFQ